MAIARLGNDIVTAGWSDSGAAVRRLAMDGTITWETNVGSDTKGRLMAVATASNGDIAAAGYASKTGVQQGLVVRLNSAGKQKWAHHVGTAKTELFYGVTWLGTGAVLAVGSTQKAAKAAVAVSAGENGVGWHKTWAEGTHDLLCDAVGTSDGGFLAVGGIGDYLKRDFLVVKASAWGHDKCATAGFCASKTATDCDDQDPCTTDSCAATSGCTHAALKGCQTGNN